jgi:lambda family phage portal protein
MSRRIREVKLNPLDKFIEVVAPQWAARRLHARARMAIAGGYIGARRDRKATEAWTVALNSPDADTVPDLPILRTRSRDLARNAPIAVGAVGTVVSSVIGSGLSLRSRPDGTTLGMTDKAVEKLKANIEREWELWACSPACDLSAQQNFYALQSLAFRSILESGDLITILPMIQTDRSIYATKLQLIEADRLDNPQGKRDEEGVLVAGVAMDKLTGAPTGYWIRRYHPGSLNGRTSIEADLYPVYGSATQRRNIIHTFDRTRPGQTRGTPYLSPVIEPMKQLDRYHEAEVMAAVVNAMMAVFIETETREGLVTDDAELQTDKPGSEIVMGSGTVIDLAEGEKPHPVIPTRPNQQFDPFVQAILRQIGVSLGLPFEVLIKHFTASYSAARAALLEAWRFFKNRRQFMAAQWCDPIFEAWMWEAVSAGRIDAPGFFADPAVRLAYLRCDWIGDAMGSIDPNKDVEAAVARMGARLSTLEQETLEINGTDWQQNHKQIVREQKAAIADGLTPDPAAPPKAPAAPPDNSKQGTQQQQGSDKQDETQQTN